MLERFEPIAAAHRKPQAEGERLLCVHLRIGQAQHGAKTIGCALPRALRNITPNRELAGVGMRYGNSSGSTTTPIVTPASVTSVPGMSAAISVERNGCVGNRFSCQIGGCQRYSTFSGASSGAPAYPIEYQPAVWGVNV